MFLTRGCDKSLLRNLYILYWMTYFDSNVAYMVKRIDWISPNSRYLNSKILLSNFLDYLLKYKHLGHSRSYKILSRHSFMTHYHRHCTTITRQSKKLQFPSIMSGKDNRNLPRSVGAFFSSSFPKGTEWSEEGSNLF